MAREDIEGFKQHVRQVFLTDKWHRGQPTKREWLEIVKKRRHKLIKDMAAFVRLKREVSNERD